MNLSDIVVQLENLVRRSCRPLINILSLDHVMDYNIGGEKEYSLLLKTCFFSINLPLMIGLNIIG